MSRLLLSAALVCTLAMPPLVAQISGPQAKTGAQASGPTGAQTTIQSGAQTTIQSGAHTAIQNGTTPGLGPSILPLDPLSPHAPVLNPLTQPALTPGMLHLIQLEAKFSDAVAAGGGKAFANWFADDAVTLGNGQRAVLGRTNIAAHAQWDPKDYQLTWVAEGAQMGPSNDMGFTWGHYEGTAKDAHGQPVVTSGRYITIWRKMPDGDWKVELDASAEEPPDGNACCALPKP